MVHVHHRCQRSPCPRRAEWPRVAILAERVFIVTDNASLIALYRITGRLLWDSEMADSKQNYDATSAPLVVNDLGVSGGDEGVRGFIAAYNTGAIVWEHPQTGPANTWGGVLSTEGGVVFFGGDDGAFSAADAKTGKLLWTFPANQLWKASPMTYLADGKQYVAVAAGSNVVAFGLP